MNKKKTKNNSKEKKPLSSTAKFIIFCAILVILFLGIVFIPKFIQNANRDKYRYNNFEFIKRDDGFWYTFVQKGAQPYWIPFYYHPTELEDIPVETFLRAKFFEIADNNGQIYITLDPDSEDNQIVIAGVEISRITGGRYDLLNVPTSSAFIKPPTESVTETGTPIVTCMHSSNKTMVIWLTLSDKNIAYSRNYCIILEAKTYEDMIRVADRTMYHLLGIMS
ncbi:hypothetical protein KY348_01630 [Candidatus Woesearchaeota archaeon]|nr:hypothetical protein [Candidatus Woesearchaeota archaeon]